MKQQIDFLKSKPGVLVQLPAKWITRAVVATLIVCMFFSLNVAVGTIQYYRNVRKGLEENINATRLFQEVAKSYPLLAGQKSLDYQIAALKQELEEKQTEYASLTHTALRLGFSKYMESLSKLVPEGLWITDISVDQQTNTASLSGGMTNPVAISRLMQALQTSEIFSKFTFHLFYVKQMINKPYIMFKVANIQLIENK
jgi:Tfp pilus assembly protein PilN